ncbi:MAG: methyltransferase [Thermodesulfobacteriota bacterium]|nr:methyltransferase [Thermodesulfobacteriota bacterium]
MSENPWHPGKLLETSGAYWRACALHAAVKLDIFTAIGSEQLDVQSIAGKLKSNVDGTERLLNALTAMELLNKTTGNFSNTEASAAFLSKKSPRYIGYMIMHHHYLVESWSRLDEAIRVGKQVRSRQSFDDPTQREAFLLGMFNNAMLMAPRLVKEFDLSDKKHLLDLGGGPGTYAVHFCKENPNIKATVYDLPSTRPFAEKIIRQFEMTARIDFQEGNYLEQDIVGQYDVIWMSHILHGEGPDVCREMILKAVSALEPRGMIIIHDFILDNSMDGPLFPALFSLNMFLGTSSGQSYSQAQITDMLHGTGVKNIQRHSFRGPTESGIITGTI